MIEKSLVEHFWLGPAVWTVLYLLDYALTIHGARLKRACPQDRYRIEGSYELTPYYQPDVDSLHRFSWRLFLMIPVGWSILGMTWVLTVRGGSFPEVYLAFLGAMVLVELPIFGRHFMTSSFYRDMALPGAAKGSIEISRWVIYRRSAVEFFSFSALFLAVFILEQDWLFLGGALKCLATAIRHRFTARRLKDNKLLLNVGEGPAGKPAPASGGTDGQAAGP